MIQFAGISLCACCAFVLLRKQNEPFGFVILLAGLALLLIQLLNQGFAVIQKLQGLSLPINSEAFQCLLKAAGIGLIAQLAQDICKDAGAGALATATELAGRVAILTAALPMLESVLEQIARLLP